MFEKIKRCLEFHDPLVIFGQDLEENPYAEIATQMSMILHHCYNETDVQFKLYDIFLEVLADKTVLPPRKTFYPVAKDIWKIKQEPLS